MEMRHKNKIKLQYGTWLSYSGSPEFQTDFSKNGLELLGLFNRLVLSAQEESGAHIWTRFWSRMIFEKNNVERKTRNLVPWASRLRAGLGADFALIFKVRGRRIGSPRTQLWQWQSKIPSKRMWVI